MKLLIKMMGTLFLLGTWFGYFIAVYGFFSGVKMGLLEKGMGAIVSGFAGLMLLSLTEELTDNKPIYRDLD